MIASRALIEVTRVHMHSKWRSVRVVMIREVSEQNLLPDTCFARWITPIHHRSARWMVRIHYIYIWNFPKAWIRHLRTWFFNGRADLLWFVIESVRVHRTNRTFSIELNIERPWQVVRKVGFEEDFVHVFSEHQERCSKSSDSIIREIGKPVFGVNQYLSISGSFGYIVLLSR